MIITPEIQPTDVAGRLRAERERLKYSLTVMAEKAEIGRATQQSYEAGATSPTVEYLAKLGRLGFDTIYMLTGERLSQQNIIRRPDLLWLAVESTLELAKKQTTLPYSHQALGDTVLALYNSLEKQCEKLLPEHQKEVDHVASR